MGILLAILKIGVIIFLGYVVVMIYEAAGPQWFTLGVFFIVCFFLIFVMMQLDKEEN